MDYVELFLHHLSSERHLSPRTVEEYRSSLQSLVDHMKSRGGDGDLSKAEGNDVRSWLMDELSKGVKPVSMKARLSALRTFYKFLRGRGLVRHNPMQSIVAPKSPKRLPVFVREGEMDKLLDDVDFGEDAEGRRDHLVLLTFYSTGMRLAELVGLDVGDVDLEARTVKVTGKRNKQRIIPLGAEMEREMRAYLELRAKEWVGGEKALFLSRRGKRMSRSSVSTMVRRYLGQVTTLRKRSPHVLRHSFATAMLNHGANIRVVQELLGHESIETTTIYTHLTVEDIKRSYDNAHPRA